MHKVLADIEKTKHSEEQLVVEDKDKIESILLTDVTLFPAVAFSSNDSWDNISWGKSYLKNRTIKWPHPLD